MRSKECQYFTAILCSALVIVFATQAIARRGRSTAARLSSTQIAAARRASISWSQLVQFFFEKIRLLGHFDALEAAAKAATPTNMICV